MSDTPVEPEDGKESERVRELRAHIEQLETEIGVLQSALNRLSGRTGARPRVIPFADEPIGLHQQDPSRQLFGLDNGKVLESTGAIVRIANSDLAFVRLEANGDVVALTRELGGGDELGNRGFEPLLEGRQVRIRRDAESGAAIGFSLQQAATSQEQEQERYR